MNLSNELKWHGHSAMMLKDLSSGKKILWADPFELKNARTEKADVVFITHAHYDHCNKAYLQKVTKPSSRIFGPRGCAEALGMKIELTEPGKEYEAAGIKFRTVPAYNIKPERLQFHPRSNNWVGYIIELNGKKFYHCGDTDFIPEMRELGKIDVAMIPIGGTYTMDAVEAAEAANAINSKITIPIHYRRLLKEKYIEAEETFKRLTKGRVLILEEHKD